VNFPTIAPECAILPLVSEIINTSEQDAALAAFSTTLDVVLEAGAGTGKTTLLRMMAESAPERKGLYLAFNKSVQLEAAASFPSNVDCKTASALAYGPVLLGNKAFKARFDARPLSPNDLANHLGVQGTIAIGEDDSLNRKDIARLVKRTVAAFANSADAGVTSDHVPDLPAATRAQQGEVRAKVTPLAVKLWAEISDPAGTLPWGKSDGFKYFLKIYQLSNPILRKYDFILFDEAQDANPVIDAIVRNQTCQKIMVGDRSQAIYGWNGAIDAMAKFDAPHRLPLTQSFRFGAAIAAEANKWLTLLGANVDGVDFRLTGFDKIESNVAPLANPDAVLCRTNGGVLEVALNAIEAGRKVAIVGGAGELAAFARAAEQLQRNEVPDHAELGVFKTWNEVVEHAGTPEGESMRMLVRLVNNYGTQAILAVADANVKEEDADVIVSTAHKAKGREWNTVQIHGDFPQPKDTGAGAVVSDEVAMLAYVAVTRAKITLDAGGLSWVNSLV
jgi:energy-coupling factor transporter ATP-binding protein EcfA2